MMVDPEIFTDASAMRNFSRSKRAQGQRIALVPTMGYLHEGHLSLIKAARQLADAVTVSIYVNPTQFAQHEDFGVYPRDEEGDLRKLAALGVDAIFKPTSLYSSGDREKNDAGFVVGAEQQQSGLHETFVRVDDLQKPLCGKSRPHFFRGVATVVAKLFNIIEPDVAVFGKKDYQQLLILQKMAKDLDFAVQVIGMPIMREADGLAMSSRNALLKGEDRQRALSISQALQKAKRLAEQEETSDAKELQHMVTTRIEAAQGRVDYVEVVNAATLQSVDNIQKQPTLIAVAAFFGSVRLIDNVELTTSDRGA